MTGRDSRPDGRKEEAQPQDQVQEGDGTIGHGRELATQDGMTTAKTNHSLTTGRTGADPEKQTIRKNTGRNMPKGFTAQPKGITAKPSGIQKNLDSSRPIGPTTKPKGDTAKPSGTLKTSEPERPVGHTAQPKGATAKPSGKTAQPKGNTAKLSGITKHRENNRPHTERQNTTLEIKHQSTAATKTDDLYKKEDAQGQYCKACGQYSKALGRPPDAWHACPWPTGRFVDSGG